MRKPLTVNWLMREPREIEILLDKWLDKAKQNKKGDAFWFKSGGMHIIVTPHRPIEPKPRYTWQWWEWIRTRARWCALVYHELDHADRDSAEHPEDYDPSIGAL